MTEKIDLIELYKLKDMHWSSEEDLRNVGVPDSFFVDDSFKAVKRENNVHKYLNCAVKGYMVKKGYAILDGFHKGVVDPVSLSMQLSQINTNFSVSKVLEMIEINSDLFVKKKYQGKEYQGVPLVKLDSFFDLNKDRLQTDKKAKSNLENLLLTSDRLKRQIPDIVLSSKSMNPFEAVAYILSNADKLNSLQMAEHIGEDVEKIELILYKYDKIILSTRVVDDYIARLKEKQADREIVDHLSNKRESLFFNRLNDVESYKMSDFLKYSNLSYQKALNLVRSGMLEQIVEVSAFSGIRKRISARSILYHERKLMLGDEEYKKKYNDVIKRIPPKYSQKGLSNKDNNNLTAYGIFLSQIRKLPILSKKKERKLFEVINECERRKGLILVNTSLFKDELDKIYRQFEIDNKKATFRFFNKTHVMRRGTEEFISSFYEGYKNICSLFEKKLNASKKDIPKINHQIQTQYEKLNLNRNVMLNLEQMITNVMWELKTLELDYEVLETENKFIFDVWKKTTDAKLGKEYIFNQEKIKNLNRKKKELESEIQISRQDLFHKCEKIQKYNYMIETIREELIVKNLRLADYFAKGEKNLYYGIEGVIGAVNKFDISQGAKLSTYFFYWAKQRRTRGIRDTGRTIKLTNNFHDKLNKLNTLEEQFFIDEGRYPEDEELWQRYNLHLKEKSKKPISYNKFNKIRQIYNSTKVVSLNQKVRGKEGIENTELIELYELKNHNRGHLRNPEQFIVSESNKELVRKVLEACKPREREIICMRIGIGYERDSTLEEVGKVYDVTRERIRQIEAKTLKKLSKSKLLKDLNRDYKS